SPLSACEPDVARRPGLPALTGLRFVAAAGIVLLHFAPTGSRTPAWLREIVARGFLGVGLFFVLSEFVLAYTYVGDQGRLTTTRRVLWTARVARVAPVYLPRHPGERHRALRPGSGCG